MLKLRRLTDGVVTGGFKILGDNNNSAVELRPSTSEVVQAAADSTHMDESETIEEAKERICKQFRRRPRPFTLFESENERQKIEPVPIPLPRASRYFPNVKTRNEKKFYNWTLEIIPFIRFGKQMDRT